MTRRTISRGAQRLAAALALLTLATGPFAAAARAHAEDEYADLQVELVGLPLAADQTELTVRVTNVSVWWADETHLRVETLAPEAGGVAEFDVENLDPGQAAEFTYTLGGPCAGRVIKAEVSPAPNYAGVPEANLANNVVQGEACPAPPPPPPPAAEPAAPAAGAAEGPPPDDIPDYVAVDPNPYALERLRPVVSTTRVPPQYQVATVSWRLPCETDGDPRGTCAVQGFTVQQESPVAEWTVTPDVGAGGSYSYQVHDLNPDQPYRYRVCALHPNGNSTTPVCSDYADLAAAAQQPGTHTVDLVVREAVPEYRIANYTYQGPNPNWDIFGINPDDLLTSQTPRCDVSAYHISPGLLVAGFMQLEAPDGDPCYYGGGRTTVQFDTTPLPHATVLGYSVPTGVERAVLRFDEAPSPEGCPVQPDWDISSSCWRSGGGHPEDKPDGCVAVRWPYFYDNAGPSTPPVRLGPREWDVTAYFEHVVLGPTLPEVNRDTLTGEDSTACLSTVSNLRLTVTYTIPQP